MNKLSHLEFICASCECWQSGQAGRLVVKQCPAILALPETVFFKMLLYSSCGGSEYGQKIQQHILKCMRLVTLDRVYSNAQVLEDNPPQKDNSYKLCLFI